MSSSAPPNPFQELPSEELEYLTDLLAERNGKRGWKPDALKSLLAKVEVKPKAPSFEWDNLGDASALTPSTEYDWLYELNVSNQGCDAIPELSLIDMKQLLKHLPACIEYLEGLDK